MRCVPTDLASYSLNSPTQTALTTGPDPRFRCSLPKPEPVSGLPPRKIIEAVVGAGADGSIGPSIAGKTMSTIINAF